MGNKRARGRPSARARSSKAAPSTLPMRQKEELEEMRRAILSEPGQQDMLAQGAPGIRHYLTVHGQVATYEAPALRVAMVGGTDAPPAPAPILPPDWFAWLSPPPDSDAPLYSGLGRT